MVVSYCLIHIKKAVGSDQGRDHLVSLEPQAWRKDLVELMEEHAGSWVLD